MSSSDEPQKVDVNKHAISLAFSKLSSKTINQQTTNRASKTTEKFLGLGERSSKTNSNRKQKWKKHKKKWIEVDFQVAVQEEKDDEGSDFRFGLSSEYESMNITSFFSFFFSLCIQLIIDSEFPGSNLPPSPLLKIQKQK